MRETTAELIGRIIHPPLPALSHEAPAAPRATTASVAELIGRIIDPPAPARQVRQAHLDDAA
jgi:hypothetical protein